MRLHPLSYLIVIIIIIIFFHQLYKLIPRFHFINCHFTILLIIFTNNRIININSHI